MNLRGGIEAVEHRHDEVEHDHVGFEALGELHGLPSIGGFTDDVETLALEQDPQALSKDLMVVGK